MTRTYDSRCHDLAKHFLADEPEMDSEQNRADLAAEIQQTVEDWIGYAKKTPVG